LKLRSIKCVFFLSIPSRHQLANIILKFIKKLDTHRTTKVGSQLDSSVSIFQRILLLPLTGRQRLLTGRQRLLVVNGYLLVVNGYWSSTVTGRQRLLVVNGYWSWNSRVHQKWLLVNYLPLVAINIIFAKGLLQIIHQWQTFANFWHTI
jgi:hypothetical protein